MIGRWIDSLSDEERDRIVCAQAWRRGSFLYEDGARCLVGHAYDARATPWTTWTEAVWEGVRMASIVEPDIAYHGPYLRFDRLCKRVGDTRAVQLVKARAGSSLSLPLPESAREDSGVGQ